MWLDATTLAVLHVPTGRGPAPLAPRSPTGPVTQENRGKKAPARTYDGLTILVLQRIDSGIAKINL